MCPRTKEQNEAIRQQRTEQILTAAAETYFRTGGGFDIRDVAKQAGLGYGTVYHYYANRHLLLEDVLTSGFERCEAALHAALPAGRGMTDEERLARSCDSLLALWMRDPRAFLVFKMAAERFAGLPGLHRTAALREFDERLYRPLAALVRKTMPQHPEEEDGRTEQLLAVLVGLCGLQYYTGQAASRRTAVRLALQAVKEERDVYDYSQKQA